jgi:ADP-ribose pyrophosphatase YjhB (NUDIX family)
MGIPNVTRPCAFVFLRSGSRVLVSEMLDQVEGGVFYRPPGGGIEFGETSEEAARRELREEFGLDANDLRLLGVLENIFDEHGAPYHEICFIYEAWIAATDLDRLDGEKVMDNVDEVARVFDLVRLVDLRAPLYPDGVRDLMH